MFGSLGLPELLLIFVVALIVFGPKKLPEIGRTLGKALGEFKKATDDLKNTIEREVKVEELKELRQFPSNIAASVMNPPAETVSRSEPVTVQAEIVNPAPAPAPTPAPAAPTQAD
ncbi:MAG TPA: TatA/E family twin arginine-targeting protein translocase [Thermoanaerobaculia bacterium]